MRVGDCRVIYSVFDRGRTVMVELILRRILNTYD